MTVQVPHNLESNLQKQQADHVQTSENKNLYSHKLVEKLNGHAKAHCNMLKMKSFDAQRPGSP